MKALLFACTLIVTTSTPLGARSAMAAATQSYPELPESELDGDLAEPDEDEPVTKRQAPPASTNRFDELSPDEAEVDDGPIDWDSTSVRPKAVPTEPAKPPANSGPPVTDLPPPILEPGNTNEDDDLSAGPVLDFDADPKDVPFIAGYKDFLWLDSLETVQRSYGADRPLVEQSANRYLIQDSCEKEAAIVIYRFNSANELSDIVCQFKAGVEDYKPDYALYRKLRAVIVKQWGQPQVSNESPAPDSPLQAVQWKGKAGHATLAYDMEKQLVQLKVEQKVEK